MSRPVTELRNLGPRFADWLAVIGIHDEDGLRQVGAAAAYRELIVQEVTRPHRMLPYALAGAPWTRIACDSRPRGSVNCKERLAFD